MKIKSKAMEFTLGLMAEDMKEIGKMGREMDQGKQSIKIKPKNMDSGLMIRDNPSLPHRYKLLHQSQKTSKTTVPKNKNAPSPTVSPFLQNKTEATVRSTTQPANP